MPSLKTIENKSECYASLNKIEEGQCRENNPLVRSREFRKQSSLEARSQYGSLISEVNLKPTDLREGCNTIQKSKLQKIDPVYAIEADGTIKDTPLEVWTALNKFGYKTFREGQEQAIMRILSGQSTLFISATGSGKSLCYQLPAYIFANKKKCITLVISPLVSLMDDQVSEIPEFLSAACLHSNQSVKIRQRILQNLKDGKLNMLLLSPETIVAEDRSNNLGIMFRDMPPIAFACIDEVHCISQWSHSFRPSYLMICKVLRKSLGVNTFLGLTATANSFTTKSIISALDIEDELQGVLMYNSLPPNLVLTISKDENKNEALIKLLNCERFDKNSSIIIYCTRREDCTKLATFLRTLFHNDKLSNHTYSNSEVLSAKTFDTVEVYHAGLSASRRKIVQKLFMQSKTKIIVSTVAFGMGINKSDIRSVIHYNMPASLEHYVQEIGRAGRDGRRATCHLFLNSKENSDLYEIQRHINAKGIDRQTLRDLIKKIFIRCDCVRQDDNNSKSQCLGHDIFFSVHGAVKTLDLSEEMITTLLYYLELHPKKFINVFPCTYVIAEISSNNIHTLEEAAEFSPLLSAAITLSKENNTFYKTSSTVTVSIPALAQKMVMSIEDVLIHLKKLENTPVDCQTVLANISVAYRTLCFRVRAPGDFDETELDEALESLYQKNLSHLLLCHRQLQYFSKLCREFSSSSVNECLTWDNRIQVQSELLKYNVKKYFEPSGVTWDSTSSPEKMRAIREIIASHSTYKQARQQLLEVPILSSPEKDLWFLRIDTRVYSFFDRCIFG
ncbi:ATP-dependent DNA helicase Q4 [Copidosoma floridanum]|uniref:ATP-dependent DNA helicase Q4 n=1 Tax=Copidosoma floridanum TaxID=29053 RepID=UPI0006C95127|nr:ATP-dependent DNA helicase Q4 [Copidosoma floridanum]